MNFRSCRYFLTVCELGTINAAARRLYISQQSLSEHIRRLEGELGVQLFHRDNPLTLTEAGRCFQAAARDILSVLDRMDEELAAIKGRTPDSLVIGCLDYGTPDFLVPLLELFLKRMPNVLIQTREIMPGEAIPADIPLLISARELGGPYQCERLLSDTPVVAVHDKLLQKIYGASWEVRRERLRTGELAAIQECPFVRQKNTPLEALAVSAFEKNGFSPRYLPVSGSTQAMTQLCLDGQAAMVTLQGYVQNLPAYPPAYPIRHFLEPMPTGYICYRSGAVLSNPARRFLEITRQYFKRRGNMRKNAVDGPMGD